MNYDIIGDIHGHAEALKALLGDLGYRETGGAWRHPSRQAIFVGDFIDRGPQQFETIDLVHRMTEAGSALACMGNHEFNAIAWFLPDPKCPDEYLRKHHSPKYGDQNRKQHEAFLNEIKSWQQHFDAVTWFLSLPIYLDLPEIRVVHACWHHKYVDYLTPFLTPERRLSVSLMTEATHEPEADEDKDTPEPSVFKAVETLLKGIEVPLPAPHSFRDKDGHERSRVRIRWWDNAAATFRKAAMLSESERLLLPEVLVPDHARIGHDGGKPVFVGHYWLSGTPELLSTKVACLDYSVAKGGKLVAYRWDGESELDAVKLHWVGK